MQDFFDDKVIEDHATELKSDSENSHEDPFGGDSPMDQFIQSSKRSRKAKRQITGTPTKGSKDLLEKHPGPFWQIDPGGGIERTYDPSEEPLMPGSDA